MKKALLTITLVTGKTFQIGMNDVPEAKGLRDSIVHASTGWVDLSAFGNRPGMAMTIQKAHIVSILIEEALVGPPLHTPEVDEVLMERRTHSIVPIRGKWICRNCNWTTSQSLNTRGARTAHDEWSES